MASWKKIIVSGSDAELNALSLSGLSNQGSEATAVMINGSGVVGTRELASNAFTSTTIGTTTNALTDGTGIADFTFNGSGAVSISTDDSAIVHDNLSGFVANEHIDHSGVTITAGTGLTGGGTIDGSRTLNVIGGDGITANADDIAVKAAQTTITGIKNAALLVGRDSHNQIDFSTDDQIKFRVGDADGVIFKASGEISASLLTISDIDEVDSINAGSGTNGNLDFTTAGTVTLRATNSTTHGLTLFGGSNGAAIPHIGTVTHEFLDFNVGSTDDIIRLSGTNGGGMLAGEARFIGHVSASSISASGHVHATKYFGDGSGLSNLTSAADGTLTLATSGAINGSATFTANQSGDTTFTVSIDDATTSAKGAASFSSDNFSVSSGAVSIKNGGVALAEMANLAADKIIGRANGAGTGVPTALSAAQVKTILSLTNVPDSDHTAAGYSTVTQLNASSSALQTNIDAKQDTLTFGISNTNAVKIDSTSVADDEYARFTANGLESRSTSEVLSDIGAQAALTFGISNTNVLRANANVANDDFLRVDGTSIEGRSAAQVVSDLGIEAGATADQTAGDIGTLFAASTAAVTFGGAVTVEGDLTVNGDLTTVNTTNLLVEDKFTTFASGSTSSTDGGIIVQGAASAGQGYGWDSATGRWAFDDDMALSATGLSPDGYVAIVSGSAQDAAGNPNYGGSSNGYGNIHINTSTGDIFIYV